MTASVRFIASSDLKSFVRIRADYLQRLMTINDDCLPLHARNVAQNRTFVGCFKWYEPLKGAVRARDYCFCR